MGVFHNIIKTLSDTIWPSVLKKTNVIEWMGSQWHDPTSLWALSCGLWFTMSCSISKWAAVVQIGLFKLTDGPLIKIKITSFENYFLWFCKSQLQQQKNDTNSWFAWVNITHWTMWSFFKEVEISLKNTQRFNVRQYDNYPINLLAFSCKINARSYSMSTILFGDLVSYRRDLPEVLPTTPTQNEAPTN